MREKNYRILAINPGSTSTKIGVFDNETCIVEAVVRHTSEELAPYVAPNGSIIAQKNIRRDLVLDKLVENNIALESLNATVGRAGSLPPMTSGTYFANDELIKDIPDPLTHPALLGTVIAKEIGEEFKIPSFFVDPTVVDEMNDVARVTGIPQIQRSVIFHALNQKAVARRCAKEIGKRYQDCNFIVAHLGGGISIAAHEKGRAVDVTNAINGEGPFSPERAGAVPALPLIEMCFSGNYTKNEIGSYFSNSGGLNAYRGNSDFHLLCQDREAGDQQAGLLYEAMAYRIAKDIASMSAALSGKVDRILITGGLAYSEDFIALIAGRVSNIAPISVYPGEDELLALAQGALRALTGEEKAIPYVSKGPRKRYV